MGKRILIAYLLGWILFVLGSCTDNSSVSLSDAGTRLGERGEENDSDEVASTEGREETGAANMSGAESSGQPEPSDVDDCALRCNDGFFCTIDSCRDGVCVYTLAPLDDPGACPVGKYCTIEQGCVAAPPCAEDLDCEEAWADDACKQSPRCDAASSVCVFSILDKDSDGHAPQVCGGDDCNDDSFDLRPGREETCDGADDNCDGIVDEQALCSERTTCVDGECRCLPEFLCGTSCPDKATSVSHCGACNNACPSDGECKDGVCGCPEDYVLCGDACVDVQDDWQNCGACENVCIDGCDNGVCFCPEGEAYCNGVCVDITSDELNCGACGHDCSSEGGNACAAGFCILAGESTCPPNLALCDEQCVDLLSDAVNCGACGNACSEARVCADGACQDVIANGTGGTGEPNLPVGGAGGVAGAGAGGAEPETLRFIQVSAGLYHACGLKDDGTVLCWGRDDRGQATPPAESFTAMSVGGLHTCGITGAANVLCWGDNTEGQAGPPSGTFSHVSSGESHTCGLRTDGSVACWGYNFFGQTDAPPGTFFEVAAGGFHTCGLASDGSAVCWGSNDEGQATPPDDTFATIVTGSHHSCGLTIENARRCWGSSDFGQWEDPNVFPITGIAAGGHQTCLLGNFLGCVGGNPVTPPRNLGPYQVVYEQVSLGNQFGCAVANIYPDYSGVVICWGLNDFGQTRPPASNPESCPNVGEHEWPNVYVQSSCRPG